MLQGKHRILPGLHQYLSSVAKIVNLCDAFCKVCRRQQDKKMTGITQHDLCVIRTCSHLIWSKTWLTRYLPRLIDLVKSKIRRNISAPTVMRDVFQRLLTFGFKINLRIGVCADLLAAGQARNLYRLRFAEFAKLKQMLS